MSNVLLGQVINLKVSGIGTIQYDTTVAILDSTTNIQDVFKKFILSNYKSEEIGLKELDHGLIYATYEELRYGAKAQGRVKCWHYVQITTNSDSLKIKIDQIKLQAYPEVNTPEPQKQSLEDWYKKYQNKINKGKQAQYHYDYLWSVDDFCKKTIKKLVEWYQQAQ